MAFGPECFFAWIKSKPFLRCDYDYALCQAVVLTVSTTEQR